MRYGATPNPVLLTLVNPGKPRRASKAKAKKPAKKSAKTATPKRVPVPSLEARVAAKKAARDAVRDARRAMRKVAVAEAKKYARSLRDARQAATMKENVSMAGRKHRKGHRNPKMTAEERAAKAAARKTAKAEASKTRKEAVAAARQASKDAIAAAKKSADDQIKALRQQVKDARKAAADARIAKRTKKAEDKKARADARAAKKEAKAAKKAVREQGKAMREAVRGLAIPVRGKGGKITRRRGKQLAKRITPKQLAAMAGMTPAERKKVVKSIQRAYGKEKGAAKRGKRLTKAFKAGPRAEKMPKWRNRDFARFPVPAMPTAPRAGAGNKRHLVTLDAWRPYVKGKGVPGWYYQPETELQSAHFKYKKNPGRKGRKGGRKSGLVGSIKRFFAIKGGKGRRNPAKATGLEILKNAAAGTATFVTGRLVGNLAARSGWFGGYERYVPVAASIANVLAVHMASAKVTGFAPYRAAMLTGAGIQLVEVLIDAFAPANVNALFDRPGGMGADLNVYEAALQDDLASDADLLAAAGMGEYMLPAEDDLSEYLLSEEPEDDVAEYVALNDDDDVAEYVALNDDDMADEVLADMMGDDLADEALADDLADSALADDLADEVLADAPAPPPAVVRARRLAKGSGHPAGRPGKVLTSTPSGGIFGQMAATKAGSPLTSTVKAVAARVPGRPGTPAHFAKVHAVTKRVAGPVSPQQTLVAYKKANMAKYGKKPRVIVRRGIGGMVEIIRPTTKRALSQPPVRSVYSKPVNEVEQGVFRGDIFSGQRV